MSVITLGIEAAVADFKKQHDLHHVIAFSGGASTELAGVPSDDPLQKQYSILQKERESRLAQEALSILRHYRVSILTGGTRFGFPNTAMESAKSLGLKTIAVFPKIALDKGYVLPNIDLPICVLPHYGTSVWGEESSLFAKVLDAIIVVGGGAGTLIEVAHLLKMNEGLLKHGHPLKIVVPIIGTGGVADGLPFVWGKQDIKSACMPPTSILSGMEAAKYIEEHLSLLKCHLVN